MSNELLKKLELAGSYTTLTFLMAMIAFSAFSPRTREIILERDNNTCVKTGETHDLEAAHIDHNKKNLGYDNASNGITLTRREHYKDHVDRAGKNGLNNHANDWAIRTIWQRLSDYDKKILIEEGYSPPGVSRDEQLDFFDIVSV